MTEPDLGTVGRHAREAAPCPGLSYRGPVRRLTAREARECMTGVSGPMKRFSRSVAVVVGIDAYRDDVPPLRCAVADAKALAKTLQRDHGFETWPLLDADATLSRLVAVLRDQLPAALLPDDRVLFYFAGHGVALDSDRGPAGYLFDLDRGANP